MESSYVTNVGACIIIISTYSYLWGNGVYGHNYFRLRDLVHLMGIIAQGLFFFNKKKITEQPSKRS